MKTFSKRINRFIKITIFSMTYVTNIQYTGTYTYRVCVFNNAWLPFFLRLWSVNYDKTSRGLVISGSKGKNAQSVILHCVSLRTKKRTTKWRCKDDRQGLKTVWPHGGGERGKKLPVLFHFQSPRCFWYIKSLMRDECWERVSDLLG